MLVSQFCVTSVCISLDKGMQGKVFSTWIFFYFVPYLLHEDDEGSATELPETQQAFSLIKSMYSKEALLQLVYCSFQIL